MFTYSSALVRKGICHQSVDCYNIHAFISEITFEDQMSQIDGGREGKKVQEGKNEGEVRGRGREDSVRKGVL